MKQFVIGYGSREWKWSADLDKLRRASIGYVPSKWRESLRNIVKTTEDKLTVDVHSSNASG